MATTNHERVGKAQDLLKDGLGPFVEREFRSVYGDRAVAEANRFAGDDRINAKRRIAEWNDVLRKTLGPAERSLLNREQPNAQVHEPGLRERVATCMRRLRYGAEIVAAARRKLLVTSVKRAWEFLDDLGRRGGRLT